MFEAYRSYVNWWISYWEVHPLLLCLLAVALFWLSYATRRR